MKNFENQAEAPKITPEQVKINIEKALSDALAEVEVISKESLIPNIKEELLNKINDYTLNSLNIRQIYEQMCDM